MSVCFRILVSKCSSLSGKSLVDPVCTIGVFISLDAGVSGIRDSPHNNQASFKNALQHSTIIGDGSGGARGARAPTDFWRRGHRGAPFHKSIEYRPSLPAIFSLSRQHKTTIAGS